MEASGYLELAKLCKASKMYTDLRHFMDLAANTTSVLSREALQLLSYEYNRFVTAHLEAWRDVREMETKPNADKEKLSSIIDYGRKLQRTIGEVSDKIVRISTEKLDRLPTTLAETTVLVTKEDLVYSRATYYKMQADYLRYKIEVGLVPDDSDEILTISFQIFEAYKRATQESTLLVYIDNQLLVLSIALNWSVFCYEIIGDRTKAIEILEAKHLPPMQLNDPQSTTSLTSQPEPTEEDEEVKNLLGAIADNLIQWKAEDESTRKYESPSVTPRTSFSEARPKRKSSDKTKSVVTSTVSAKDMEQIKKKQK